MPNHICDKDPIWKSWTAESPHGAEENWYVVNVVHTWQNQVDVSGRRSQLRNCVRSPLGVFHCALNLRACAGGRAASDHFLAGALHCRVAAWRDTVAHSSISYSQATVMACDGDASDATIASKKGVTVM